MLCGMVSATRPAMRCRAGLISAAAGGAMAGGGAACGAVAGGGAAGCTTAGGAAGADGAVAVMARTGRAGSVATDGFWEGALFGASTGPAAIVVAPGVWAKFRRTRSAMFGVL